MRGNTARSGPPVSHKRYYTTATLALARHFLIFSDCSVVRRMLRKKAGRRKQEVLYFMDEKGTIFCILSMSDKMKTPASSFQPPPSTPSGTAQLNRYDFFVKGTRDGNLQKLQRVSRADAREGNCFRRSGAQDATPDNRRPGMNTKQKALAYSRAFPSRGLDEWHPQWDSNPCFRLERAAS